MFALPGIVALIVLTLLRPQEFVDALEGVPLLYIAIALALIGAAVDLATGRATLRPTPITAWALGFVAWAAFTMLLVSPADLVAGLLRLLIGAALCLVIAHAVQTPASIAAVAAVMLGCALALSALGVHQAMSPQECLVSEEVGWVPTGGVSDGRPCESRAHCYEGPDALHNVTYLCEHVGLFGTTSIDGGRVRYRGELGDPNELALTVGASLPLVYVLRRPSSPRLRSVLAVAAGVLVTACVVLTGSRGGVIALVVVLLSALVAIAGARGAIIVGIVMVPTLVIGGRSGEGATSSTSERVDSWAAAIDMFRAHPLTGVGYGQFTEHHYLTAHNAFLLALAEMGLIGMFLFVGLLYCCGKILWTGLRFYSESGSHPRRTSIGLLAAFAGLAAGMVFLSFTYHHVLWMFVGLCGAYYSVARREEEQFRVAIGRRDVAAIAAISATVLVGLLIATRLLPT